MQAFVCVGLRFVVSLPAALFGVFVRLPLPAAFSQTFVVDLREVEGRVVAMPEFVAAGAAIRQPRFEVVCHKEAVFFVVCLPRPRDIRNAAALLVVLHRLNLPRKLLRVDDFAVEVNLRFGIKGESARLRGFRVVVSALGNYPNAII